MELGKNAILRWLESYARDLETNKEYLTQLDGAIGDNDHGINMDRGFRKVMEVLPAERDKPMADILKAVGMTLIRTVGGAAGPLYGTVFLRMAQAAGGKEALTAEDLGAVLEAGRKGIVDRGKAEPDDKTMLDTWQPAVQAYREATSEGKDLQAAVQAAAEAAERGMQATTPLVARKGRASYLGERSRGHQDPGATSSYLLFKSLAATLM
ncbi:MAG: dihydroxyacetone kinase subunit L [Chloroflexi bacterium]|nr:dihydroxyacetone kinase subunit L [Chloroflexota bacterium]